MSAERRFRTLVSGGYIDKLPYFEGSNGGDATLKTAYALGGRGEAVLRRQTHVPLPERTGKRKPAQSSVAHQLATNRVARDLEKRFYPEHLSNGDQPKTKSRRNRPDATFECSPDSKGRFYVAVEIDLGHYNRQRVLDKVRAFKEEKGSREMWWVAPTEDRRDQLREWFWDSDVGDLEGVRFFTFDEIEEGKAQERCPEFFEDG